MWKPAALALSVLAVTGCKSDKKDAPPAPGKPVPGSAAPGTAAPGIAAPGTAAPGTAAPGSAAPPAPLTPLTIEEKAGDGSCFTYALVRDGKPASAPKEVFTALECPIVPPVLTPDKLGVVYVAGDEQATELKVWTAAHGPHRLVMFDPGVEGVSVPRWSASGTKLAVVVKGTSYPKGTRLFALTVSPLGEVTDKQKIDVAVFAPCGSACTPEAAEWKDDKTLEVVTPGEGEPGPKELVKL